jgi:hypothetical protein
MVGYEYGRPETIFCKTLGEAMEKGAVPCPVCSGQQPKEVLEPGVLHQEIQRNKKCPKCGQNTMTLVYRIIDGGAVDTSEFNYSCPCGHKDVQCYPNTSDFAY